ncbi:MAG TPA: GntR family transcriptional regulator [Negativicutes bacterium]|nr:GntR family transcriptional regulator [Negativicutes bacterium]
MPDYNGLTPEESSTLSLKERAYKIIRQNIISCAFPPGFLLNEKDLVEKIGVSRTPIREALNLLAQEQMVTIVPQRGSFVTEITPKTINDVFQVREMLEPLLARLVTPIVEERDLIEFRDRFMTMTSDDYEAAMVADKEFHNYIVKASNNIYLINLIDNLYAQNARIRAVSLRMPQRMAQTQGEHLAIIDAMLLRNEAKAAEAMRRHMVKARLSAFDFSADYRQ